jgi:holo-[acyl-carrier protein] synthase|tara:strand:+ start:1295 stop:1681 length:387 start_codon:yes stop_codon:yes gene_type:complete
MKILGIGVDIINNKRIRNLIGNKNFIQRTFGKNEIKLSKRINNKTNYFAKRFAAKESLAKSLGTGFRNNLNFKDIEVLNDRVGRPYYSRSKKIANIINKQFNVKKYDLFLSITDEKDYSIAFTILQTK